MEQHNENETGSRIMKGLESHAKAGELYSQGKTHTIVGFESVMRPSITLKECIWG